MMTIQALDFPAIDGRPVTQAHANHCAANGHATHTVDGIDTGICPRCGDAKGTPSKSLRTTRDEILRLKALQSEGRMMAGMGVFPWDRKRGAETAESATVALVKLMAATSVEDLAAIRKMGV